MMEGHLQLCTVKIPFSVSLAL